MDGWVDGFNVLNEHFRWLDVLWCSEGCPCLIHNPLLTMQHAFQVRSTKTFEKLAHFDAGSRVMAVAFLQNPVPAFIYGMCACVFACVFARVCMRLHLCVHAFICMCVLCVLCVCPMCPVPVYHTARTHLLPPPLLTLIVPSSHAATKRVAGTYGGQCGLLRVNATPPAGATEETVVAEMRALLRPPTQKEYAHRQ